MKVFAIILTVFVALDHIYFLILEMFLWTKPMGIKAFGLKSKQFAEDTKVMAANQGLYNGFLVVGLVYSLLINDPNTSKFFLSCIIIAGFYGAYAMKKIRLFYIQAIPAIIALILNIL